MNRYTHTSEIISEKQRKKILYIVWEEGDIIKLNLMAEVIYCINPFNKKNEINNLKSANCLHYDMLNLQVYMRENGITNIILQSPSDNYVTMYNYLKKSAKNFNKFNSLKLYYQIKELIIFDKKNLKSRKYFRELAREQSKQNLIMKTTKGLILMNEKIKETLIKKNYLSGKKYIVKKKNGNFINDYNKLLKLENKIENQLVIREKSYPYNKLNHFKIDMYNKPITVDKVREINKNIEIMTSLLSPYKRILFICCDYPGYGGAATNCGHLQNYFSKTHETYGLYFNSLYEPKKNKKYEINENYKVIDFKNLIKELKHLKMKPDLVILKSFVGLAHLNLLFNCPIYYFVGGIFKNDLNKYYYKLNGKREINKYINHDVLNQIDYCSKIFVNSVHTYELLKKYYNIKNIYIFYSSYISYYNLPLPKLDTKWKKRRYEYGVIMSNFERKIKNSNKTIKNIIKSGIDPKNVILIGRNSHIYSKYGFVCKPLQLHDVIIKYYKLIKYLIQDSYYESSSNLKVEGFFNNCKFINDSDTLNLIHNNDIKNEDVKIGVYSTQYPHNGGASTLAYNMHKYLCDNGINSKCCFFLHPKEERKIRKKPQLLNPSNYKYVYHLPNEYKYIKQEQNKYKNTLNALKDVNIVIAVNYGIIPIIKNFYNGKMIYLLVGSPELTIGENSPINNNMSCINFLSDKNDVSLLKHSNNSILNKISLEESSIILTNTKQTNVVYNKIYPEYQKKIHYIGPIEYLMYKNMYNIKNNVECIQENRIYDLIAISNKWSRQVKNVKLVYSIFTRFPNLKKIIIGTSDKKYDFEKIPNTTIINKVENKEVHKYLNKSKILLFPSYFESAGIVILEALNNNCKILTSKNVGLSHYLDKKCVCEDVNEINEWVEKIYKLLTKNKFEHGFPETINNNLINFLKMQSKITILVACGDMPNIGGAATNSYNLLKLLKKQKQFIGLGLFITNLNKKDYDIDPDNINNIYHLKLDESIKENALKFKNELYKNNCHIDIIFCKNYKIMPVLKFLFPKTKIVFSPSGLRYLSSEISRRKIWYNSIKNDKNLFNKLNTYELKKTDDLYKFIKKNDRYLDDEALNNSDYILPNSNLSYEIIKKGYDSANQDKILEPIYLSNITERKKKYKDFKNRLYDIGFVCYNWKRGMKNYELVVDLINSEALKDYNIIVIGMEQKKELYKKKNVIVIDFLEKNKLIEMYDHIKTVVIPSTYDSNPNVLTESVFSGCNVVSSSNVGNTEFLHEKLLVKNESNINNWIDSIQFAVKEFKSYTGPMPDEVKTKFLKIINDIVSKNSIIL